MKCKLKHQCFVVASLFAFAGAASAKDCDSELNGHLAKVGDNLKANAEVVLGVFHSNFKDPNETSYKPMLNGAAELQTTEHSSLFMNGSLKYKVESKAEEDEEESEGKKGAQVGDWRLSLRDAYFQSKGSGFESKIGFMTYTLQEQLLLDDRGLGFDITVPGSLFTTRVFAAGVLDPFSREKQSCISKNTFRPHEESEEEGSDEGHEKGKGRNFSISKYFGGIRLDFSPSHHDSDPNGSPQTPGKEGGDDEFQATTTAAAVDANPTRFGLMYFLESKDEFSTFKHFPGAYLGKSLLGVDLSTEMALQITEGDSTFGYIGKAYRSFVTESAQVFKLFAGYTAYHLVKGDKPFEPSYSNMFLGEVNQYLTKENKIGFFGVDYFPMTSIGFHVESLHKMFDKNTSELDVGTTYYYLNASKIKVGANWLYGQGYPEQKYQVYGEIRHIF